MHLVGVGVPGWPSPSTGWDWWPILGIALALLVARRGLRLPLRAGILIGAVVFGPIFAFVVHAWGAVPALASVAVAAAVLSWGRTRRTGDDPTSPV